MAGYQRQTPPRARFSLQGIMHHSGRSLTQWRFVDAKGGELYGGASFGLLAADGRLRAITGFFRRPDEG